MLIQSKLWEMQLLISHWASPGISFKGYVLIITAQVYDSICDLHVRIKAVDWDGSINLICK